MIDKSEDLIYFVRQVSALKEQLGRANNLLSTFRDYIDIGDMELLQTAQEEIDKYLNEISIK